MREKRIFFHTGTDMQNDALVRMKDISKSFGHIKALNRVDLSLGYREIIGLVGDNAAGKSTLLKTLAGVHIMDEGEIYLEGKVVEIKGRSMPEDWGSKRSIRISCLLQIWTSRRTFFSEESGPP